MNVSVLASAPSGVIDPSTAKRGLPESLRRLEDHHDIFFIWDPEHNRLIWANKRGLTFWHVETRLELKDIPFSYNDRLCEAARQSIELLQSHAECIFDVMLTKTGASARCSFVLHPLPSGNLGVLVHVIEFHSQSSFLKREPRVSETPVKPIFEHGTVFPQFEPKENMNIAVGVAPAITPATVRQANPLPTAANQTIQTPQPISEKDQESGVSDAVLNLTTPVTPSVESQNSAVGEVIADNPFGLLTLDPAQTLEELHVSIIQIDKEGRILYSNHAAQMIFQAKVGKDMVSYFKEASVWEQFSQNAYQYNRYCGHAHLFTFAGDFYCRIVSQRYKDAVLGETYFLVVDEVETEAVEELKKAEDAVVLASTVVSTSPQNNQDWDWNFTEAPVASEEQPQPLKPVLPFLSSQIEGQNALTPQSSAPLEHLPVPERTIYEIQAVNKATAALNALDAAGISVLLLDRKGQIQTLSPTALSLFGRDPHALLGSSLQNFIQEGHIRLALSNVFAESKLLQESGFVQGTLATLSQVDGSGLPVTLTIRENSTNEDDGSYWLVMKDNRAITPMVQEIARLKAQVMRLSQQQKNPVQLPPLPHLVSVVSHEIRSPLNALLGFTEIMKNEMYGPLNSRYAEYVDLIREAAGQVLNVAENILDYGRVAEGVYDFKKEPIHVASIINAVERMLKVLARKRNVQIVPRILEDCPPILADSLALQQVMINIVTNALTVSPEGEKIFITAGITKLGRMMIEVTDQAKGMSAENVKAAYEMFAMKKGGRGDGIGLGLPLSREMVERMGGEFFILTKEDDHTRIRIVFPIELILRDTDDNIN